MDEATRQRIEQIEVALKITDTRIAALEGMREEIVLRDEEYANYVEQYRAYYDDEPLPIRQYYEKMAELEAINEKFNDPDRAGEIEILWQQYGDRIEKLERLLAA